MAEETVAAAPSAATEPVVREAESPTALTTVSAHFKMIFIGVMAITVLTLFISVGMAIFIDEPTEAAKSAMDTCSTLSQLGFGAMVGLLGGKAVS